MSSYELRPGQRIKVGRDITQDNCCLPLGSMGTVVSVSQNTAVVRFDAPPVELTLDLDAEPFWIELSSCTGYSVPEDGTDTSPNPKD